MITVFLHINRNMLLNLNRIISNKCFSSPALAKIWGGSTNIKDLYFCLHKKHEGYVSLLQFEFSKTYIKMFMYSG
jgi:hypothetical protein